MFQETETLRKFVMEKKLQEATLYGLSNQNLV